MSDGKVRIDVTADNSQLDKNLNTSESKLKSFGSRATQLTKNIALGIGGALAAGGLAAVKFGSEFEQGLANASTLFGETQVDMESLQMQLLEVSDASGVAASELTDSLYNALSAGVPITEDATEAVEFLDKATRLAKGGFTDVDTAVTATAKTLNTYKLGLEDVDRVQGVLVQTQNLGITTVGELGSLLSNVTPVASAMNVSFEQVGASLALMTSQGTATGAATTQLNSLISELGKTGTKASDALAEATKNTEFAGKSFSELSKEGVPLNQILDLMSDHAEANNLSIIDMFGSIEAGKAALAISGENSEAFTENLEAMNNTAGLVDDSFNKVSDTTREKFAKNINELKNVAVELFLRLQDGINRIFEFIDALKNPAENTFIQNTMEDIEAFILIFTQWADENSETIDMIIDAFKVFAKTVIDTFKGIVDIIVIFWAKFGDDILDIIAERFLQIIEVFTLAFEIIKNAFELFVDLLTGNWEGAWENIKEILESAFQIFIKLVEIAFSKIFETIFNIINDIINVLVDIEIALIEIWNGILDFLTEQLEKIKMIFEVVFETIADIIFSVFDVIGKIISNSIDGNIKLFNKFLEFIKNVFTGNWADAWKNIVETFGTIFEGIANLAKAPLNFVISQINSFIKGLNKIQIPDFVPGIGGKGINIPLIPKLAAGGLAFGETLAMIGDNPDAAINPEVVAPLDQLENFAMNMAADMNMGSQPIMVNNMLNATVEVDGMRLATIVLQNQDDAISFL